MDTRLCVASLLALVACCQAFNCSDVSCPHGSVPALLEGVSAVPCPEDSHRPLVSHMYDGAPVPGTDECCLAPCKCRTPCPPPPSNCPANAVARVFKPATGRPGACCPEYHCASHDHEDNLPGDPPALALHSPRPHASGVLVEPAPGGCVSEKTGGIMANGYEWLEDPCTTCRCVAGERKCYAYMCKISCDNPRHVPEECCPACDSTSVVTLPPHCPSLANCSLRCRQGLLKDQDGCFLCQCQAEECKLDCPQGYSEDSLGNKLCECAESDTQPRCPFLTSCKKNCTHGLRTNRRGCPVCKCNKCRQIVFPSMTPNADGDSDTKLLNTNLLLCKGPCLYGYVKDDRGCRTCLCKEPPHQPEEITTTYSEDIAITSPPCHSSDGKKMGPNDVWFDGCHKCHCIQGSESCTMVTCPPMDHACNNPVLLQGQCCPICADPPLQKEEITTAYSEDIARTELSCISSGGKEMGPSDIWLEGCRECRCIQGSESCTVVSCPPAQHACDKPVLAKGHCCPICKEATDKWTWIAVGVVFIVVMIIVAVIILFLRNSYWKPSTVCTCIQKNAEDGGELGLNASPSPSPTHSPVATTQSNGTCKNLPRQYNKTQLSSCRESYTLVPPYDTA